MITDFSGTGSVMRVILMMPGGYGFADVWCTGSKTKKSTLFTIPVEAVFNCHDNVYRSALVGVGEKGKQKPVIIIEPEKGFFPSNREKKEKFKQALFEISSSYSHCSEIDDILFHRSFPVDIRHNAKIYREKLAQWAEGKLR